MLPQQKEAIMTLICSIVFIVTLMFIMPMFLPFNAEVVFILLAVFNTILWMMRRIAKVDFKALDEMEKTIRYKASFISTHAFSMVVIIYVFFLYVENIGFATVPMSQVLKMAYYSYVSLHVFRSVSILILYKTGAGNV